jgi:hypothetical protein
MSGVPLPLTGGCLCGACRYAVTAPPLMAYACHCTDCQTQSGSAFALTMLVSTEAFDLSGALTTTNRTTPGGRSLDVSFCAACHVRLFARGTASPAFTSIRVGTLDDANWVQPIAQFYPGSALPWALIPGVPAIPPEVVDFPALMGEWSAIAPTFIPAPASNAPQSLEP